MKWTELLRATAERANVDQRTARAIIEAMIDEVNDQVGQGDSVSIRGLGTVDTRKSRGRTLRSISSGRKIWVGERATPRFRAAKRLRESASGLIEDSWRTPEHQAAWRLAETLVGDLELYHQDECPNQLPNEGDVDAACADAFGAPWNRARSTYRDRAGSLDIDYLSLAARRRWGSRRTA